MLSSSSHTHKERTHTPPHNGMIILHLPERAAIRGGLTMQLYGRDTAFLIPELVAVTAEFKMKE